jgi:hypothetical protein
VNDDFQGKSVLETNESDRKLLARVKLKKKPKAEIAELLEEAIGIKERQ